MLFRASRKPFLANVGNWLANSRLGRGLDRRWKGLRTLTGQRWLTLLVTFALVTALGAVLLSALRQYPEPVHAYLNRGPQWLRVAAAFVVTFGGTLLVFRLFNPRLAHLRFLGSYPPGWAAWVAALVALGAVDLAGGLGAGGYQAEPWEWLVYPGGAIGLICLYRKVTAEDVDRHAGRGADADADQPDDALDRMHRLPPAPALTRENFANNWPGFRDWLLDDKPTGNDLIGNMLVADRIACHLFESDGTVGLVGPYGSGKSSIIAWAKVSAAKYCTPLHWPLARERNFELWFCEVTCWGFEDTSAAITQILTTAVATVGEHVDCFSIRHLPETYRKTFSAGGDWVRTLLDLVLGSADPLAQFQALSDILGVVKARLVIVIEDLDRATSSKFDQKEMAALLYRLKATRNVSFVLAAGPASSDHIDFAKLCTHIEFVRGFEAGQVAALIDVLRGHCLKGSGRLGAKGAASPWGPTSHVTMAPIQGYATLAEAASQLIRTPRSLKRVLSHTYQAWRYLAHEMDFDDFFIVNTLRHAAPEAFNYLIRHYEAFRLDTEVLHGVDHPLAKEYARYPEEWAAATRQVDWDSRAALALITYMLPGTAGYFGGRAASGARPLQGIATRRYWERAVNQHVDAGHVRDETVRADLSRWISSNGDSPDLVSKLCKGGDYIRVFDHLAPDSFKQTPADVLTLGTQLFDALRAGRASLVQAERPPEAFYAFWRLTKNLAGTFDGEAAHSWVEGQITASLPVSVEFVNEIARHWVRVGSALLRPDAIVPIRFIAVQTAEQVWSAPDVLLGALHRTNPYDLYRFLFPPSEVENNKFIVTVRAFRWLGPLLVRALEVEPTIVARKVAHLISNPVQAAPGASFYQVDTNRLDGIFNADSRRVLETIADIAKGATGEDKALLTQVAESGLKALEPQP